MSDQELRLSCLQMANNSELTTEEVLVKAQSLYDFAVGKNTTIKPPLKQAA